MPEELEFDLETGLEVEQKSVVAEPTPTDPLEDEEDHNPASTEGEPSEHNDEELSSAEDDEEREAIRERRRQERKNRKTAQREREETLRRELASRDQIINELRSRVDQIDNRNKGSELAQLDNAKKQLANNYNFFKDQIRIATEAGNGAAVAEATEKMILAKDEFDKISGYEKALKNRQAASQPLDPRLVNQAQDWMKRNPWYDPSGRDQDSSVAMRLDQSLAEEGWDPTTPQYWEELNARVKKYLPHRANSGKITTNKPKSVVQGSGRETGGSQASKNTYTLSAERVQGLKDAGMWEDPKLRAEAIKRFREFDKQNKA